MKGLRTKKQKSIGVSYGKSLGLCVSEGVRVNGNIGTNRNTRNRSPNFGRERDFEVSQEDALQKPKGRPYLRLMSK